MVGILGTVAIPALSIDLNLPDGGSEPVGSTQREAYDQISKGFGPGYNGPLVVAVDITQTTDIQADLNAIGDKLAHPRRRRATSARGCRMPDSTPPSSR